MEVSAYLAKSHQLFSSQLFHRVQMAGLFADSKTFADAVPKQPVEAVLAAFEAQQPADDDALRTFVDAHFDLPEQAKEPDVQSDDVNTYIEKLWPQLTRPGSGVTEGSLLPLPCPYLVPGGRFREIYYWDSYFTALGLMESGHVELMRNMVNNFIALQQNVGLIPNGSRTYYNSRSQPPVLALMVRQLAGVAGDDADLNAFYLQALKREHAFWMNGYEDISDATTAIQRVVRMPDGELLNRFWDDSATPRPESYREDVEAAANMNDEEACAFYRNIRAACESGWDFSSRWLADPQHLLTIQTTDMIPVDLNCLMVILEQTIASLSRQVNGGQCQEGQLWEEVAEARATAVNKYCWQPDAGVYVDFNHKLSVQSTVHALSTVLPLFAGIADKHQAAAVAGALETRFLKNGGLVTSLCETRQQWDAPNGWAPLQWFAVQGLQSYEHNKLAGEVMSRWLNTVDTYYKANHTLMEKYNVEDIATSASGGEYEVQHGFGWTNGVTQVFAKALRTGTPASPAL